ncbi:hypothetical protein DFH08DRAFT_695743, partial [Mycena albidolilacea]
TLYCAKQRHHMTGSVTRAHCRNLGHPHILAVSDTNYLLQLVKHKPTTFLDKYTHYMEKYCHLPVSITTIHCTFERAGLNVKRVQQMASERDPLQAGAFLHCVAQYPAHYLVSTEEMSKDNQIYARLWGREPMGGCVEVGAPFVCKQ